jgi:hypothetical protein
MANTTFSGPVNSLNGFISGTSASPIAVTTAQNINASYGTTSATSGDTRLVYDKLTFTGAGGSGETLRAFSVVTVAGAAVGGTINGAHISMSVTGSGTISGAGNALRATLGLGASTNAGGTLAALQVDSDIAGTATVPATASFIRVTNSNSGSLTSLFNLPSALVPVKTAAAVSHTIRIMVGSTPYYLMVSNAQ